MLLKKGAKFVWESVQQKAFATLKQALCTSPILIHPRFDLPFILQTDASRDAIGAILSQKYEGAERVVAYASRRLSKSEKNYGISDKEGLAMIFGVKHFRPYLHGTSFVIETDHAPLKALLKSRDLTGRLARWALILQEYDCDIIHKPGELHANVDALTRTLAVKAEPCSTFSDLSQQLHFAKDGTWIGNGWLRNEVIN